MLQGRPALRHKTSCSSKTCQRISPTQWRNFQLQVSIHENVGGKLGKRIGYAKEDVKAALSKDEPSTIKDAYLIIRINQLMTRSTWRCCGLEDLDGIVPF